MRIAINSVGALATGAVLVVVTTTKFTHGAWIVLALLPVLVLMFAQMRFHYRVVAAQVALKDLRFPVAFNTHTVMVPISGLYRQLIPAWRYAQLLSKDVRVVYIDFNPQVTAGFRPCGKKRAMTCHWWSWRRRIVRSCSHYWITSNKCKANNLITSSPSSCRSLSRRDGGNMRLHNQTALQIKGALLFARGVVVTSVPYHLRH